MQKCFYGLVQTDRQCNKKAVEILKKVGFTKGNVNICLYMKQGMKGKVYKALDTSDDLMVWNPEAIDEVFKQLQKHGFVLKVVDGLQDFYLAK